MLHCFTIFTHELELKCFVHHIFCFFVFVTFGDELTKILHNLCLNFARQDGQDGEKTERKSSDLNTKKQNTKIRDEQNKILQLRIEL